MYLTNLSTADRMWHKINFQEYNWFEFWIYFLLDRLPNQS